MPSRLLFYLLLAPSFAQAGTFTAATCNYADVNTLINGPTHTAVDGDIINVPAGSCTWTSGLTVPNNIGISIIGAGSGNTIITDNYTASASMIVMRPQYGNALSRISAMALQPQTGATLQAPIMVMGTCASGGCPNLRVDNINFPSTWNGVVTTGSGAKILANNMFGVLDHNSVNGSGVLVNVNDSAWLGVGQFGDNSWASADTFGTAQTLFIENNTFNATGATETDLSDAFQDVGGGRYAVRFNTFTNVDPNGAIGNHGTESTGRPRGGRQIEAYGNSFSCTNNSQGCSSPVSTRSGVSRTFLNSYARLSGSWYNNFFSMSLFRAFAGFQPWAYCSGLGPWDTNDGTVYDSGTITGVSTGPLVVTDTTKSWTAGQWVNNGAPYSIVDTSINDSTQGQSPPNHPGYEITSSLSNSVTSNLYGNDYYNGPPVFSIGHTYQILRATVCIDQPTRSGGTLLSGGTPITGAVGEALDPSYEWGDTMTDGTGPNQGAVSSQSARIIANRDFYYEVSQSIQTSSASPFNGTVGTGYGTLANRPTTCTTGVGYYATNQGTWNTTNTNFPGQSFSQGQLYLCTSTNTWTLNYTPYTYPHPLDTTVGGAPTVTTACPLISGTMGTSYNTAGSGILTASGGTSPYTWSISAGALPAGLSISGNSLIGTPTTVGSSSFTLLVTDNVGSTGNEACSMTVNAPPSSTPVSAAGNAVQSGGFVR